MSDYKDEIENLVSIAVDDHYEGSGVNDRTLGTMYFIKKYAKAADELYEAERRTLIIPTDVVDRRVFQSDNLFSAQAQLRAGSKKVDTILLYAELTALIQKFQPKLSMVKVTLEAQKIIDACTAQGKDTVAVTIIEDKR